MKRRLSILAVCLMLVIVAAAVRADAPAPGRDGRTVLVFDPADEQAADAAVGSDGVLRRAGDSRDEPIASAMLFFAAVMDNEPAMAALAKLPHLRTLRLICCVNYKADYQAATLKAVARLKQLRELDLSSNSLRGEGLKELARLPHLQSLDLTACGGLNDPVMRAVGSLRQLRSLDLSCTNVTDAGLKELSGLKQLRRLNLEDCDKLTKEAVGELRAALPDCEVTLP
jgi:hypothetical protein